MLNHLLFFSETESTIPRVFSLKSNKDKQQHFTFNMIDTPGLREVKKSKKKNKEVMIT